jgi:hypothetical protein
LGFPDLSLKDVLSYFDDKTLYFVIGTPKSGTTWLQQLLDSHREISCRGEDDYFVVAKEIAEFLNRYNQSAERINQIERLSRNAADSRFCTFTQADLPLLLEMAVRNLIARATYTDGCKIIGTKFPNFTQFADVFDPALGRPRYLHIVRDPRDVLVSAYYFNLLRDKDTMEKIGGLASYMRQAIPFLEGQLRATLNFMNDGGGDRVLTVRYHELHQKPLASLAEAFTFLGADASEASVQAAVDAANFAKVNGGRSAGSEDRSNFYRKGVVGDWREKFDADCRQLVAASKLGDLMRQFDCPMED